MRPTRRDFIRGALGAGVTLAAGASPRLRAQGVAPPEPYGPLPSARQLRWHELEFYGFLHFPINTFTDREWGCGDESSALFDPTAFDADQIVRTAREAGMAGLVLTCKHHDGFCLWPSSYTTHSVRSATWKAGRRDVVREVSEACRRRGLRFGVYLSLGPQPRGLRSTHLRRVHPQPAARVADGLRPDLRGVARRREWRRRVLRRRARDASHQPRDLLRLAGHLGARAPAPARCRALQRCRTGRALGRQRARHRGRDLPAKTLQ